MGAYNNLFGAVTSIVQFLGFNIGSSVKEQVSNEEIIEEAFYNGIVNKAVDYIADNVKGIPMILKKDGKPLEEGSKDYKTIMEFLRSNKLATLEQNIYSMVSDKYYFGDHIMKIEKAREKPVGFQVLGSNCITIEFKKEVNILEDNVLSSVKLGKSDLDVEDIILTASYNPRSNIRGVGRGVSKVKPIIFNIKQINKADEWNMNYFDNNLTPAGMFSAKSKLGKIQIDELKEDIETKYAGASNGGKPMVVSGDMTYTSLADKASEANYNDTIANLRRYITTELGVPSELLGDSKTKTYASYGEARKSFYEETAIPEAEEAWGAICRMIKRALDIDLTAEADRTKIPALQEDETKRFERIDKSQSMMLSEKRKELDLEEKKNTDFIVLNSSQVPLELGADPTAGFEDVQEE